MAGLTQLIQFLRLSDLRLSWLLQGLWIAGILPILIASIPSSRLTSFHLLVLGFARRGKILPSNSSQKFTVPQKFFLHFYVFSVLWTTALLAMTWHYAYKVAPLKHEASNLTGGAYIFSSRSCHSLAVMERFSVWKSGFLLMLMEIQALRRLYETLFVFKYSRSAPYQMDEFSVMGEERMPHDIWGYLEPFTKLGWCAWTGASIYYWGWIHQRNCHAIFGSLRRDKRDQDKHVIPKGDWFDYVSCPHYLAEMVIYAGISIASGGTDLTIWLAFAFTVTNLCFAAGEIHRWYLEKFEDYPRDRKAVIPFIY